MNLQARDVGVRRLVGRHVATPWPTATELVEQFAAVRALDLRSAARTVPSGWFA